MKKVKKRFGEIDLLKGFAALLVVLIHVTAHYRGESDGMYMFWDLIHFSVGVFVIVSGFLQAHSVLDFGSAKDLGAYLLKKFKRIVIPYYIFAILFIIVSVVFGNKTLSTYLTFDNIKNTLLLWGGVGNNWIPRLFMSLTAVVVVESLLSKKFKWIKPLFFSISLSASLYLVTRDLSWLSKFNNLPGWLVIFYIGQYIYHNHSVKTLVKLLLLFGALAFFLNSIMSLMGLDVRIFSNKWPPDLYFVSYNIAASAFVWLILLYLSRFIVKAKKLMVIVKFLSISSYEIFFYHLLVLEVWTLRVNWFIDWLVLVLLTSALVFVIRKISDHISYNKISLLSGKHKST